MAPLKNIVVIGGSYVGVSTAQSLHHLLSLSSPALANQYRILLIEKNTHFHHLFAFPRFAVTSKNVETRKAFIPYSSRTFGISGSENGEIGRVRAGAICGVVKEITSWGRGGGEVVFEKEVDVEGDGVLRDRVGWEYLVLATGTSLSPPSAIPLHLPGKANGVSYLQKHASLISSRSKIVLIGGGAVGVQMATDIKELFPEKEVTLVHSRDRVMHKYHEKLHEVIAERCRELGVKLVLGSRVKVPKEGYPTDGKVFKVELESGDSVETDLAIICTGQTPQSQILSSLSPSSIDDQGFVKVSKTLQIRDSKFANVFAVGDVADTGAHKAARPGSKQAAIVAQNIFHLLNKESLEKYDVVDPPGIHMSLGITKNIVFRNPEAGSNEPMVKYRDDGKLDMGIDGVWEKRGGGTNAML